MYVAGFHKNVFEWLIANEFLSNSKNYLCSLCIFIFCFSIFCVTCFPTYETFEFLSNTPPKSVFVDLLEKYVCVSGFEFLRTLLKIFIMFVKVEVCEIVFILNSSTEYEFSAATFIFNDSIWSVYYYYEMLAYIDRQENGKRLVAYDFQSWQINWSLTPREKLFTKTSITSRLGPICSWFSFEPNPN